MAEGVASHDNVKEERRHEVLEEGEGGSEPTQDGSTLQPHLQANLFQKYSIQ